MMDLKIFHSSARLAAPAISCDHFAAKLAISFRIKPQAGSLLLDLESKRHLHFFKELPSLRHWKTKHQPNEAT